MVSTLGRKKQAGQGLGSWFKTGLLCASWASGLFHTILGHIHILLCVHVWCFGPEAGRNKDLCREDLVYSTPLHSTEGSQETELAHSTEPMQGCRSWEKFLCTFIRCEEEASYLH